MTDLKLHYAPDNASLVIRLAMDHINVPYKTVLADRSRHAQRDPVYLALNPNGLIPTLETPDGVMFETAAILLWLDRRFGGLMPNDSASHAQTIKWLIWLSNSLHPNFRMLFYPDLYTDGNTEDLRAPTRRRIAHLLTVLSDAKDADWLESSPCAPAFYLAPLLRWSAIYGGPKWFNLADYPRLLAFAERLEQTEAARHALAVEGLGPTPFSSPQRPNPPEGSAL